MTWEGGWLSLTIAKRLEDYPSHGHIHSDNAKTIFSSSTVLRLGCRGNMSDVPEFDRLDAVVLEEDAAGEREPHIDKPTGRAVCVPENYIATATYAKLDAKPCDEHGNYLPPGTPLSPPFYPDPEDWSPFNDRVQFETVDFLFRRNQMSASDIDTLSMLWTATLADHDDTPSFNNHKHLYSTIDSTMLKEYDIWYRDPRIVVQDMLANPEFKDEFDYTPLRQYVPRGENLQKCRKDFMSGDWAWDQVDDIMNEKDTYGRMFVPIIVGSDKTTVSITTGQHNYYPLYASIGNIHNNVHNAHRGAVALIGFLSIPKAYILRTLKPGPYIANYPEQALCTAKQKDLDGDFDAHSRTEEFSETVVQHQDLGKLWDVHDRYPMPKPCTSPPSSSSDVSSVRIGDLNKNQRQASESGVRLSLLLISIMPVGTCPGNKNKRVAACVLPKPRHTHQAVLDETNAKEHEKAAKKACEENNLKVINAAKAKICKKDAKKAPGGPHVTRQLLAKHGCSTPDNFYTLLQSRSEDAENLAAVDATEASEPVDKSQQQTDNIPVNEPSSPLPDIEDFAEPTANKMQQDNENLFEFNHACENYVEFLRDEWDRQEAAEMLVGQIKISEASIKMYNSECSPKKIKLSKGKENAMPIAKIDLAPKTFKGASTKGSSMRCSSIASGLTTVSKLSGFVLKLGTKRTSDGDPKQAIASSLQLRGTEINTNQLIAKSNVKPLYLSSYNQRKVQKIVGSPFWLKTNMAYTSKSPEPGSLPAGFKQAAALPVAMSATAAINSSFIQCHDYGSIQDDNESCERIAAYDNSVMGIRTINQMIVSIVISDDEVGVVKPDLQRTHITKYRKSAVTSHKPMSRSTVSIKREPISIKHELVDVKIKMDESVDTTDGIALPKHIKKSPDWAFVILPTYWKWIRTLETLFSAPSWKGLDLIQALYDHLFPSTKFPPEYISGNKDSPLFKKINARMNDYRNGMASSAEGAVQARFTDQDHYLFPNMESRVLFTQDQVKNKVFAYEHAVGNNDMQWHGTLRANLIIKTKAPTI
ncbi:hypothetical protein OBBRIDRAFT_804840 [Obba rivulosa]|uniref:Uncharacterized protein n=1 Tax=Obba rivulosa TaxID=1052685 RepID=A0A8E2AQV6_9APHY|nr:hypothetical protein OBBRIDRAFT_804840 [Obba rivulosa]